MADKKAAKIAGNNTFEFFDTPSCGRGTKAIHMLNKGINVMSSEPLAFVSRNEFLGSICDACLSFWECNALHRCSNCKLVYYCNAYCQKKAWLVHKHECKHLKKVFPSMPSDTIRLTGLLLLRDEASKWLKDLVSHTTQIQAEKGEMFTFMIAMIKQYLNGATQSSGNSIFNLFCKINCNAFTICDGEHKPLGLGIYPTLAFLNHSCKPNCIAVFDGPRCNIRSIRKINENEELCISYTELLRPHSERQKHLKEQYYFDCECSRCLYEMKHGSEMNALKCVKNDCSHEVGFFPVVSDDERCPECGTRVPKNYNASTVKDLYSKIEHTLLKVNKMQSIDGKLPEALRCCETLLTEAQTILHIHNYQVVKIVDKISDLCISSQIWETALHYCRQSLQAYLKFYLKYHPNTAIQLYRIGKLEVHLDRLGDGLESLSQARALFHISYGEHHSLTRQLNQQIAEIVQEKVARDNHELDMIK